MADKIDHSVVPSGDEPLFPASQAPPAQSSTAKPADHAVASPGDSGLQFAPANQATTTTTTTSAAPVPAPGGNLLPQQGPTLGPDKTLGENLAILGQGFGQIGHGIYNYGRSAGNFASMNGLDRLLAIGGQYAPDWTPSALRPDPSFANQQAQTQQARTEMGPGMTALSGLTGLRGFSRVAGPLAGTVAGESIANPALQGGAYMGGESAIAGDDPKTIALKTGLGVGTGTGVGVIANKVVSPVVRALVTKYYGGSTPEELAQKLGQTATGAEQQATTQTATAQQALDEQLSNIRIPSKDLGFKIAGQTDPSVADVQGYRDWLQSQGADAGVAAAQKAPSVNYTGPTHLYDEGDAGYRQWLKNQAVRNAPYAPPTNLPTATQRMMESVNQQLNNPAVAGPTAAAQAEANAAIGQAQDAAVAARANADRAAWLASAGRTAGAPGADVPGQATKLLAQPGLSPAEIQAYTDITQSGMPGKGPALWQAIGRLLGGSAAGGLIHGVGGTPTEAAAAGMIGQHFGGEATSMFVPNVTAATKAAIARSWPALTGEWPASARGQLAGSDAIRTLYGLQ